MARSIFILAVLAATISLGAQQPMSPNQPQGVPQNVISVNPPPTIVVAGSGLYGPSVFMAPAAGFAPPQAAAGATQTGYIPGSAGISLNTQPYLGVTSTLGPAPLVYEGGQPGYAYTPGSVSVGAETAAAAATPGRLINDLGPSYYSETGQPPPPKVSLGEVAASFRATQEPRPIRVYTNPPAQQLEPTLVVTGAAIATNVIPETVVVQSPQSATAVQTPQAQAQAPQVQPATPPQAQQSAGSTVPPPPATAPSAPAPQAAGQEPAPQLPATSTLLPLLGLLGLVSGAIGVWLWKSAK
ncbi:MAG TPA: hypothetical protein VKL40_08475 [Candidatus Angelobacter sp.]|nr:hypothetical protein [Candidatus Angelobacter sp.]